MKAFFIHPATIIIGSILILIGIGWIGKKYWGWFAPPCIGCGVTPPKIQCNSTVEANGNHQYKFSKVFPSKNNDGTYIAMFVITSPAPQGISSTEQRVITKEDYDRLVRECGTQEINWQDMHQDSSTSRTQVTERTIKSGGKFNANGTPAPGGSNLKQKSCGESCADNGAIGWSVVQYPKGHIYHPYYDCWCHMGGTK